MTPKERILANLLDLIQRVQDGALNHEGWEREIINLDREIQDIIALLDLMKEGLGGDDDL